MNRLKTILTTSSLSLSLVLLPLASQNLDPNYIDPGTGSLIIQVLVASFVGALFLIKIFWGKVKAFFGKVFSRGGKGNG